MICIIMLIPGNYFATQPTEIFVAFQACHFVAATKLLNHPATEGTISDIIASDPGNYLKNMVLKIV